MERAAKQGWAINGRTPSMAWPLVGSAAGHAILLSALLLLGAAARPGTGSVVQVTLVEGTQSVPSGAEASVAASPGGVPGSKTARQIATAAPRRLRSSAEPAEPLKAVSRSPGAIAGMTATPPAAAPKAPTPGLEKERLVASSAEAQFPSPPAPSGGTIHVASIRAGEGAAPKELSEGEGSRGSSDGDAGKNEETGGGDAASAAILRDAIQSRIAYPDEAIRRGLEGEVLLHIRVSKGGRPGEIRVARSSGARILDEAARRGVIRAAPLPSAPGWIEVPVRFLLLRPAGERP